MTEEFNETIGKEKGIIVKGSSQGSVNDLETNVLAVLRGEVGAADVPDIFMAYADTAYTADQMGGIVDLKEYLTEAEIFQVSDGKMTLNFEKETVRKLWDNYYIPFIKGYFAATGRFRSDDVKTGNIIAFVGSSSSASFFPNTVNKDDNESYPIEMDVLPCPGFAGGGAYAVQQGAGMVVTEGSEAEISRNMEKVLPVAVDMVNNNQTYTTKAFEGGTKARNILEYAMSDLAAQDRAVVAERLSAGQSLEEAAAEFCTDAYFDAWYEETLGRLQAFEGK